MAQKYSNNTSTTLSSSITNVATSISVVSSATFPTITASDYFLATLYDISGSAEINHEIIKVTGVSGTTLTVVRGQEGTTARSFASGTRIEVRFTAGSISHYADKDSVNTFSDTQSISVNTSTNALTITQTGTGNALVVEDSANPDSTPVVVTDTGRFVIGYTTSIAGVSSVNSAYQQHGLTNAGASAGFYDWQNVAIAGPIYNFNKSKSGTIGTRGIVASGDRLGAILFGGDDGTNFISAGQIACLVDGTPGTNDMPGRLTFSTTADGASTLTERMRITATGNVGIGGTPAPSVQLNLLGTYVSSSNVTRVVNATGTAPTSSTSEVSGYISNFSTADGIGAVTVMYHFGAFQGTVTGGTRTAPTNQHGFFADSSLTGATNNYGFYSNIASGTGCYNFYANGTAANYFAGDVQLGKTVTVAGTTGAQTINKTIGSVNFAAATTSLVVTNNLVTTSSIITATVGSNDSTMKSVAVVAGAGSFTLYANAAPTAETRVNFHIFN